MKRFGITVLLLLLVSGLAYGAKSDGYTVRDGKLGPCLTKFAVPTKWNGNLLIIAHGRRGDDEPLSADFGIPVKLVSKGWLVACTSYRRNGWVVDDAIADIADLRAYVDSTYGKPKHAYICGASMGGMIVTKMAEMQDMGYDGVLAIGAALWFDAEDPKEKLCFSPRTHLLFLSNRNELDGPKEYLSKVAKAAVQPVLWHVGRDGHCNVTDDECTAAVLALVRYHDTGKITKDKNATIVPKAPRSVAVFRDGKAFARVTNSPKSVDTEFVAADLSRLGIAKGSNFVVSCGDKSAKVLLGVSYFDVPEGEWVAFMTAEGFLKIARNWANAAETLGCKKMDTISIEPAKP